MLKLDGKKIYLKKFGRQDFEQFYNIYKDKDVTRFLFIPTPLTRKKAKELFEQLLKATKNKKKIIFGIYEKKANHLVGLILLDNLFMEQKYSIIGYSAGKKFWRKGYIKEATYLICKYGFQKLKLNRIESRVVVDNIPSLKFQKRIGMTREGVLRKAFYSDGKYRDFVVFSMLKSEFKKSNFL